MVDEGETRFELHHMAELVTVVPIAQAVNAAMGGMLTVELYMTHPRELTMCVSVQDEDEASGIAASRIIDLDMEAAAKTPDGYGPVMALMTLLRQVGRLQVVIAQLVDGAPEQRIAAAGLIHAARNCYTIPQRAFH